MKTQLKAATGEFRNNWHKYLPLAVLNHNTTYHASLGCEPSRVFHGRIPHNILDYKLGYNPNPRYQSQTYVAEETQKRMRILLDQTKKNIMQSYLKYKAYYDKTAKQLRSKRRTIVIFSTQKLIRKREKYQFENSDGVDHIK